MQSTTALAVASCLAATPMAGAAPLAFLAPPVGGTQSHHVPQMHSSRTDAADMTQADPDSSGVVRMTAAAAMAALGVAATKKRGTRSSKVVAMQYYGSGTGAGFQGSGAQGYGSYAAAPNSAPSAASVQGPPLPKAAINGFGRIGRNVFRVWLERPVKQFEITMINIGKMPAETAAHLLKYDTVLGTLPQDVTFTENSLVVDGRAFMLVDGLDPSELPWGANGVEIVIEATGKFNSMEGGSKHLEGGAKKVVLTAPGDNCPTYVVGVNTQDYTNKDTVISNASCTTNGMASVCKVLDDAFGVDYGTMTTTHSYTGDQCILDGNHGDLRRARSAAQNIIPTSTGAAQAVAKVLPKFEGKLNGIALRVPIPNVSIVDLVVKVSRGTTVEEVNQVLRDAAEGAFKGIIKYETAPLVSSDFLKTPYSASVDAALTMVMGEEMVKVVMWYDNEWGYSQRVVDLTGIVSDKIGDVIFSNQANTFTVGQTLDVLRSDGSWTPAGVKSVDADGSIVVEFDNKSSKKIPVSRLKEFTLVPEPNPVTEELVAQYEVGTVVDVLRSDSSWSRATVTQVDDDSGAIIVKLDHCNATKKIPAAMKETHLLLAYYHFK